jgi:hypothetical protein
MLIVAKQRQIQLLLRPSAAVAAAAKASRHRAGDKPPSASELRQIGQLNRFRRVFIFRIDGWRYA